MLIVHTVGVRAGTLTRGLRHSEALELTERFSLDPQTQSLKREFVAADSLFFREPYRGIGCPPAVERAVRVRRLRRSFAAVIGSDIARYQQPVPRVKQREPDLRVHGS